MPKYKMTPEECADAVAVVDQLIKAEGMTTEEKAIALSDAWHAGQTYGVDPARTDPIQYTYHTRVVAETLKMFGYADNDTLIAAAHCHDLLEDTDIDVHLLHKVLGDNVLILVDHVTSNAGSRKQRHREMLKKLSELGENVRDDAVILKCADRIANYEACLGIEPLAGRPWDYIVPADSAKLAMYHSEHQSFFETLMHIGDETMWAYLDQLDKLGAQRLTLFQANAHRT